MPGPNSPDPDRRTINSGTEGQRVIEIPHRFCQLPESESANAAG